MSGNKTTSTTNTTVTPTKEETELNKLLLERQRALNPQMTEVQGQQLDLASILLSGGTLPGNLSGLTGTTQVGTLGQMPTIDASKYQVGEDVTSDIVQRSLADIAPQFQMAGILDSGVAASLSGELAKDIRLDTARSNMDTALAIEQQNIANQSAASQFDISNQYSQQAFDTNTLLSLLNLTLSGSTALQSPVLAQSQQLSNALAGLRSTTGTTTQTSMNPFLLSFQQSAGQTLGSPSFSAGPFGFGG